MAKVTQNYVDREIVLKQRVPSTVMLELTKEETRTLLLIIGTVNGTGARVYNSNIYRELNKIIKVRSELPCINNYDGHGIYLNQCSKEFVENDDNWC